MQAEFGKPRVMTDGNEGEKETEELLDLLLLRSKRLSSVTQALARGRSWLAAVHRESMMDLRHRGVSLCACVLISMKK